MATMQRQQWARKDHARNVERFYGTGTEKFGEFHGGYLNFGLWTPGVKSYLEAAENMVLHLGGLLGLSKSSRVLDVACGMGAQDVLLHKEFGASIDAVDVTWKHVEHARKRAHAAGFDKKIRVHHASATNLPFAGESFSHVLSIEGPEHFDTREAFFGEAFRVLKKDGVMVLADYTVKKKARLPEHRLMMNATCKIWQVPKANVYDSKEYAEKLAAAGFRDVQIAHVGKYTIPGYYFEQQRAEVKRELAKIRGWWATYPGALMDVLVYQAFRKGLIEYVFVRAVK